MNVIQTKKFYGTTLISIINKAIDDNEKNGVEKEPDSIYYEQNQTNSIKITIKFQQSEKIMAMEDIKKSSTETFVALFNNASFKCTNIQYHEKTNYVKSMHFEQTI